jgi:hypothetical protein
MLLSAPERSGQKGTEPYLNRRLAQHTTVGTLLDAPGLELVTDIFRFVTRSSLIVTLNLVAHRIRFDTTLRLGGIMP